MKTVHLKKNQDKRVRCGHPWVFKNEIGTISEPIDIGEEVLVYDFNNRFIGKGFFHPNSFISVRILTRSQDEPINKEFLVKKIRDALLYRKELYPKDKSFRAFFAEGDGISGLIVDKYKDALVVEIFSAGVEKRKDMVKDALIEVFQPSVILAKNDINMRKQEGLTLKDEIWFGTPPDTEMSIEQDGIKFFVDLISGQKTGFFFDQRENRQVMQRYTEGKKVLDCFSYTGAFGLYAAKGGAASVLSVDSSKDALAIAQRNADNNGFKDIYATLKGDAFRILKEGTENYDIIIIDPPALAKNKSALNEAIEGYKNLNKWGLQRLNRGGILCACSCSYHITKDTFKEILITAATSARCQTQVLEWRNQSKDHPILLAARETEYLKCVLLRKI